MLSHDTHTHCSRLSHRASKILFQRRAAPTDEAAIDFFLLIVLSIVVTQLLGLVPFCESSRGSLRVKCYLE